MKTLFKLIGGIFLIGVVFGAGYLAGRSQNEELKQLLDTVKSEMKAKVTVMEDEIRSLRVRVHLVMARDHLLAAEKAIKERNFGMAEEELQSAKADLRTAAPMTSKETGEHLTRLERSIGDVIETVRRSDPHAKSKLDPVKTDLDRLIKRS